MNTRKFFRWLDILLCVCINGNNSHQICVFVKAKARDEWCPVLELCIYNSYIMYTTSSWMSVNQKRNKWRYRFWPSFCSKAVVTGHGFTTRNAFFPPCNICALCVVFGTIIQDHLARVSFVFLLYYFATRELSKAIDQNLFHTGGPQRLAARTIFHTYQEFIR